MLGLNVPSPLHCKPAPPVCCLTAVASAGVGAVTSAAAAAITENEAAEHNVDYKLLLQSHSDF